MPLEEELVSEHPTVVGADMPLELPQSVRDALQADPSQLLAAQQALSQRLSIIQGPPGTGKTYVGIQIVKALLQRMPGARILCLCYTNHALDSFLESLLDNGVSSRCMIRFGSMFRISDRIKDRSFQRIESTPFSGSTGKLHFAYKSETAYVEERIKKTVDNTLHGRFTLWQVASSFLEEWHYSEYSQLSVDDHLVDDFGMTLVGKAGKAIQKDYLWQEWLAGKSIPEAFRSKVLILDTKENIWRLNRIERLELCKDWEDEFMCEKIKNLTSQLSRYSDLAIRHSNLKEAAKMSSVGSVNILACTTTFAAKSRSLIDSFRPNVLLVEEAAELHESHVLTNVSSRIKHLIMIGDHKQLRPKLQSYTLAKDSGNGVDFDVSLFERLILGGYPYATLQVQHRMRPEISALIKCTYPELLDHASTQGRDGIRGVPKNLFFVDHRETEGGNNDDNPLVDTGSKYNEYEVNMLLKIARYLLQQGYKGKDIVILTPYLGQLMLLRKTMRKYADIFKVEMGDRDEQDLADLEDDEDQNDGETKPQGPVSQIRIATIDNYQGEESKIILASLVRSNDRHDIGFVSTAERVNVLMSRARDGLILIGNAEVYRNASSHKGRDVWSKVFQVLDSHNAVYDGFPALCSVHKNVQLLKQPDDFDTKAPNGGCNVPCNASMPSCPNGHLCTLPCHPFTAQDHSKMKCTASVDCQCIRGIHLLAKECGSEEIPRCNTMVDLTCADGHVSRLPCSTKQGKWSCRQCAELLRQKRAQEEMQRKELERMKEEMAKLEEENTKVQQEVVHSKEQLEILRKQELLKESIKIGQEMITDRNNAMKKIKEGGCKKAEPKASVPATKVPTQTLEEVGDQSSSAMTNSPTNNPLSCSAAKELPESTSSMANGFTPLCSEGDLGQVGKEEEGAYLSSTNSSSAEKFSGLHFEDSAEAAAHRTVLGPITDHSTGMKVKKMIQSFLNGDWINTLRLISVFDSQINVENILDCTNDSYPPSRLHAALIYLLCCQKVDQDKKGRLVLCMGVLDKAMARLKNIAPVLPDDLSHDCLLLLHHYGAAIIYASDSNLKSLALHHADLYITNLSKMAKSIISEYPWFNTWQEELQHVATAISSSQSHKPKSATKKPSASSESSGLKQLWEEKLLVAKKSNFSVPEESMSSLLNMTGLKSVKEKFIDIYDMVQMTKEQGMTLSNKNFNTRFDGNPGTGKTTVAKLFMKFMTEVGVLPKSCEKFLLRTGSELSNNGVSQLTKDLEDLKKQGGGVVFVDEAYQLDGPQGHKILDYILGHSERMNGEFGSLIWIFAGYKNKMDDLFKHNVGLPSRFPNKFNFEDYSDEELLSILSGIMERGGADVVAPAKPSKSTATQKPTSLNMNGNSKAYGYSSYGRYAQQHRSPEVDQWGNTWYWDSANFTFYDDYNNISGIGATGLGSQENPLVSRNDNTAWLWHAGNKQWYDRNNPSRTATTYPGKPVDPQPDMPAKKSFRVTEQRWLRIAVRRLGRQRNVVGFGNARAVRNLFDTAHARQVRRTTELRTQGFNPDIFTFDRSDLLGPKATMENLEGCEAWQELLKMEGLHSVKQSLRQLLNLVITNADREEREEKLLDTVLNRIFLGNPGTGKTTVAQLYGSILASIGLLSKGEVILKNASDFIGSALGKSEEVTRGILEQSKGCVLVIDEAYGLYQSTGNGNEPYREAVINTLVEQIQGKPGEDRAVVLLGYREEMEVMLKNCNPGLSRRFQLENAFIFEDYDDLALTKILSAAASKDGLDVSIEVCVFAVKMLSRARAQPHFGNAGAVNNLLSSAKLRMQDRLSAAKMAGKQTSHNALLKEDFTPPGYREEAVTADELLGNLVGCDNIREQLEKYKAVVEYNKACGKDPTYSLSFNYIFTGKPGTGKTTIARLMGKLFSSLGLIPCEDVVEISASDLMTGYVGQTGKKTRDIFMSTRGKVLFVDEAYQLNPGIGGTFMQEAVDEIVKLLTDLDFKNKMIVILAGYKEDMDKMLNVNQGLRSRFTERIHFDDFSIGQVKDMIDKALILSSTAKSRITTVAGQLVSLNGFANGRDVETFLQKVEISKIMRLSKQPGALDMVEESDLAAALKVMLVLKGTDDQAAAEKSAPTTHPAAMPQFAFASQSQRAPPPPVTAFTLEKASIEELPEVEATSNKGPDDTTQKFLSRMQTVLDRRGLNSLEGVTHLSSLSPASNEFTELATELARELDMSEGTVRDLLSQWQGDQAKVRDELQKQQQEEQTAKKMGRRALLPIWRCAVCGRADLPYIFCYVQPFIVRYEERDLK